MTKKPRKNLDVRKHLENPHPVLRLVFIAIGGLMLLGGIGILWAAFTPIPDLNSFDSRKVAQSTKIYYREGKTVLYDLNHYLRRNFIPLS